MKLLIVDDEARILAALRRTLRREGYEILTAESGEAGLRILDQGPVDVILSDHKMPGMSGSEFLRAAASRCPGSARLLITGWSAEISPGDLEAAGVAAVIPKPWDDAQLKQTLRKVAGDG